MGLVYTAGDSRKHPQGVLLHVMSSLNLLELLVEKALGACEHDSVMEQAAGLAIGSGHCAVLQGGQLVIQHSGKSKKLSPGDANKFRICFTSFYAGGTTLTASSDLVCAASHGIDESTPISCS